MNEDIVSIGTAFLLVLMVCATFVDSSWALNDSLEDWSSNDTAHAKVVGTYNNIGSPYGVQIHEGNITEGNNEGPGAYTRFYEYNQTHHQVFDSYQIYLCNYTGSRETYTHEGVYFIQTWTHSYYDLSDASKVDVEIGPPGVE